MENQMNLVTYTALAIVMDQNIDQIQKIREIHDPAYPRWPPHINLFFPFVHPQKFQSVHEELQKELNEFKQFQITFKEVKNFPHGVCYLQPETQNKQIHQIYQKVVKLFPQFVGKKHKVFTPHLTIANKIAKHQVQNLGTKLQSQWKETSFICTGLSLLQRQKDTPFRCEKFVRFAGKN